MAAKNPLVWATTGYLSEIPSTDQLVSPVGAVGLPGITFRGATTTGFYYTASTVRLAIGGVLVSTFSAAGLAVVGAVSATTSVSATTTVSAGTTVTAGTSVAAGTFVNAGTLYSIAGTTVIDANRLVLRRNYAFAGLPAATPDGAMAFVTDSNQTLTAGIGTAVAGGGANKVPVYADTSVWKIG